MPSHDRYLDGVYESVQWVVGSFDLFATRCPLFSEEFYMSLRDALKQ